MDEIASLNKINADYRGIMIQSEEKLNDLNHDNINL